MAATNSDKAEDGPPRSYSLAFYSGAGIGLLIGLLMGLALSPTVGVIIGALAASLAVLLGLNDRHFSNAKAVRIGSFGFACVLGAILGIFVRVNSFLAPDLTSQFEAYTEIGYSEKDARKFIAYERFSILDKDWKMHVVETATTAENSDSVTDSKGGTPFGAPLAQTRATVGLFSAEEVDESQCERFSELSAGDSSEYILQNLEVAGGIWKELALAIDNEMAPAQKAAAILTVTNSICEGESVEFGDENCQTLATISEETPTAGMFKRFNDAGGIWQNLAAAIKTRVAEDEQKKLMHIVVRSACNARE